MNLNTAEKLSLIQRNQAQIDLLAANNTQLIQAILTEALLEHQSANTDSPKPSRPEPQFLLEKPRKQVKRRVQIAQTEPNIFTQADLLMEFAKKHNGVLNLQEFRTSKPTPKVGPSFFKTTIYTVVKRLVEAKLMKKMDQGLYQII